MIKHLFSQRLPGSIASRRQTWFETEKPKKRFLVLPASALLFRSMVAAVQVAVVRKSVSMRRYLVGCAGSLALCWIVAIGYLLAAPSIFTSKWSLILPTSSSSVSLQLETIGHAQTVASSPFGSSSLSPKVIYKEIISSEQVRIAAAKTTKMSPIAFGSPRVKLIDETAMMLLEISGRTPAEAKKKAIALNAAFEKALENLRHDEIKARSDVVKKSLTVYQENLQAARARIVLHQDRTGVLSINQFNEGATSLELVKRHLSDVRADIQRLSAEQSLLASRLGVDASTAAKLVKLAGDPSFGKMAVELGEVNALYQQESRHLGDANPAMLTLKRRATMATGQLRTMLVNVGAVSVTDVERLLLVTNGSQIGEMMRTLVSNEVQMTGRMAEAGSLEQEIQRRNTEVVRMSHAASRLEDLKKAHIVAEAVFTSAWARLDTNRVDIYASYPMVQILAAPDFPQRKSNPGGLVVLACAVLASMLSICGWSMAWLRHVYTQKRQKSV
jgi:uncharacterized protein involved in exopolysaccharide biosynthesis